MKKKYQITILQEKFIDKNYIQKLIYSILSFVQIHLNFVMREPKRRFKSSESLINSIKRKSMMKKKIKYCFVINRFQISQAREY